MKENDRSYLDENLREREKTSGRTRLPASEEEGGMQGQSAEQPYPGPEGRNERDFARPDDAGDGDRRS